MDRRVHRIDLIKNFGRGEQSAETVSEASRHEQLFATFSTKFDTDMSAVGSGRAPEIDDDIKDLSPQNSDQLGLLKRRNLEV
jgi:hypothetical protein